MTTNRNVPIGDATTRPPIEGLDRLKGIGKRYWVLLAFVVVVMVALIGWLRPVQNVLQEPAETLGRAVDVLVERCPNGWTWQNSGTSGNIRTAERCIKGTVVVTLLPGSDKAQYGLDTGNALAQPWKCREIPGWDVSRCD